VGEIGVGEIGVGEVGFGLRARAASTDSLPGAIGDSEQAASRATAASETRERPNRAMRADLSLGDRDGAAQQRTCGLGRRDWRVRPVAPR
jgi:hypothetical protein